MNQIIVQLTKSVAVIDYKYPKPFSIDASSGYAFSNITDADMAGDKETAIEWCTNYLKEQPAGCLSIQPEIRRIEFLQENYKNQAAFVMWGADFRLIQKEMKAVPPVIISTGEVLFDLCLSDLPF